ncbi:MAG TPA: 5-formyltetrahydrofolate cyclo-ligase [Candidatus Contendobacter sp.]|nr:5-formyltetrahydrofolate cyclo-ligase [Candidatus Contendobacter sp.]HRZ22888.1 5-formyltetrahydrofolate cyclo-ligase [Candidatus Contendobacter sp.]
MTDDPRALRQRLRERRRALSPAMQRQAALAVASRLEDWPEWISAVRVAGYWACDGELDPAPLLERAWSTGRSVYLPVLDRACALHFAPYSPGTPMRRNRFNIPEPAVAPETWLEPSRLDLVLTPLVTFDPTGTRLGMGGGFYDRTFAFLRDPGYRGHRPVLLGLGYEFQHVAALVRHAWDVPLDAAVTEAALRRFSGE